MHSPTWPSIARARGVRRGTLLVLLACGLLLTMAGPAAATTTRVVMSGLDNPRGLAFGPEGALYVAEAGRGGPGPCFVPPLRGGLGCYGPTGGVSRLWRGKQDRSAARRPARTTSRSSAVAVAT